MEEDNSNKELKFCLKGWNPAMLVSEDDIKRRFAGLGGVERIVQVYVGKKNNSAFVTLEINKSEEEVFSNFKKIYDKAIWKGGILKFEQAKPDFKERMEFEKQMQSKFHQEYLRKKKMGKKPIHSSLPAVIKTEYVLSSEIFDETDTLKLRRNKRRNGVVFTIPAKVKKITLENKQLVKEQLQESIELSYCCTTGDAGRTINLGETNKNIQEEEEEEGDDNNKDDDERLKKLQIKNTLGNFVQSLGFSSVSKKSKKTNADCKLLIDFRAKNNL